MTKIAFAARYADDTPYAYGRLTIRLVDGGSGAALPNGLGVTPRTVNLDADGEAIVDLTPNADISDPVGTFYAVTVNDSTPTVVRYIEVPAPNGSGNSEIPYDWDDPDLERLTATPPTHIPAPGSGTVGQVLGVVDPGDGPRYDLIDTVSLLTPARRLGATWCIDARSAVGTSVWADQGRAGVDMVNTGRGAAVVQPGAFTGLRPYGPFFSEVGAVWPSLLDVRWKGKVRRQRRDPANEWIEALLVTIDSIEDWLEPAYVNGPDGWILGLDLRLDGEDSEREFLGTTTLNPDQDWCWRYVMDGTDVVLYRKAFSADLLVHTGWTELEREAVTDLPMTDPGSETAGPYTLAAPPEGTMLGVSFTGALVAEAVLLDDIDGDPLHHFRASDGAEGATTVTTSGETWTAAVGLLSVAPDNPTMTRSDTGWGAVDSATFDIDSDQSVSWAWRGRPWPVGGSGSTLVVGDNALAMFTGGAAGWGFASAPGSGVDWAFLISDGSGMVVADAGAAPTGYVTVAAVLDRSDDTVRLYIDTELVATADGSSLGAIASTGVVQGYSDLEWVAMWPRALDVYELAYLQGSI